MATIRNIGFSFVFILIIVSQLFAFPIDRNSIPAAPASETADSVPVSEFQNPVSSYLFGIETNNSTQSISEVYRLGSLLVLSNQITPLDFDFRSFADFPIPTIYSLSVPIFIRGHALLN